MAAVHPGALIANIGHFKKIFVDPRIEYRFLKERFMGAGRAGRYNHPIQILLFNNLGYLFLGILGAAEEIIFSKDDIGQGFGVFDYIRNL